MYSALAVADAAYDAYKLSQLHYITLHGAFLQINMLPFYIIYGNGDGMGTAVCRNGWGWGRS